MGTIIGYIWGLYRDYYKDPFPHSLLSTREFGAVQGFGAPGSGVYGFRVTGI